MSHAQRSPELSRRHILLAGLAVPLASCAATRKSASHSPDGFNFSIATHMVIEGPYFKLLSPERASLREVGVEGPPLLLTGRVIARGQPLANAVLDFWQADGNGHYDLVGYHLRGHQLTDGEGRYHLETVMPGQYLDRTPHIHVKVQPPGELLQADLDEMMLTTQLYFPGQARNHSDPLFDPTLVLPIEETADGRRATFDFVLG